MTGSVLDSFPGLVGKEIPPVKVSHNRDAVKIPHKRGEPRFTLPQGRFGVAALGYIEKHPADVFYLAVRATDDLAPVLDPDDLSAFCPNPIFPDV